MTSTGSILPTRTSLAPATAETMPTTVPSASVTAAPLNPAASGCPCPVSASNWTHSSEMSGPGTAR